jgi:hypothetical protein
MAVWLPFELNHILPIYLERSERKNELTHHRGQNTPEVTEENPAILKGRELFNPLMAPSDPKQVRSTSNKYCAKRMGNTKH